MFKVSSYAKTLNLFCLILQPYCIVPTGQFCLVQYFFSTYVKLLAEFFINIVFIDFFIRLKSIKYLTENPYIIFL